MGRTYKVIDADGHVMELDSELREFIGRRLEATKDLARNWAREEIRFSAEAVIKQVRTESELPETAALRIAQVEGELHRRAAPSVPPAGSR